MTGNSTVTPLEEDVAVEEVATEQKTEEATEEQPAENDSKVDTVEASTQSFLQ